MSFEYICIVIFYFFSLPATPKPTTTTTAKPSYSWRSCSSKLVVEQKGVRFGGKAHQFVIGGNFSTLTGPAYYDCEGCSIFYKGKIRALSSCEYLEKSNKIGWIPSKNGKIEPSAVMYKNIALGRALHKDGDTKIGRIVNSSGYNCLVYNDGKKEYKVYEYEALVSNCQLNTCKT